MEEKKDEVVVAEVVPAEPKQPEGQSASGTKTLNLGDPALRMVAFFIDAVIYIVFVAVLQFIFGMGFAFLPTSTKITGSSDLDVLNVFSTSVGIVGICILPLIHILFSVVYLVIVPGMVWPGQTLGMKLLGLKFVKTNGNDVTSMDMFVRSILLILFNVPIIAYLVCCVLPIAAIANLVLLFTDEKNQTLFDKMAGTIVIKE